MRIYLSGAVLALGWMLASQAAATEKNLDPISNQGHGQLPSGYDLVTFTTGDGNWAPNLILPAQPRNGDRVRIKTDASYASVLHAGNTNMNLEKLEMHRGQSIEMIYDAGARYWRATGSNVANMRPSVTGASIPAVHPRISIYEMRDSDWTQDINLPSVAADGDAIAINSSATYGARINPANVMFASTFTIKAGDRYSFVYSGEFGKWMLRRTPVTQQWPVAQLPPPTSPHTYVYLANGRWTPHLTLPRIAGDRDRITVRSDAAYEAVIGNAYTSTNAPTVLYAGADYEHLDSRETGRWELVSAPGLRINANTMPQGAMPRLKTPSTVVQAWNGNHTRTLNLPAGYGAGTRVVVDSKATWPITVNASGTPNTVTTGELASFVVNAAGKWQRETRTIDLLLLYSGKLAASLGENAARTKMYESFNLTNEALTNSQANFRDRLVGLRKFASPAHWKQLGDATNELRGHATAQAWRNSLRADGIYYEGTEDGCGLAWVRSSAYNIVATDSVHCGITVMRHEMVHNMGLSHGGSADAGYAQGYLPVRSIMAGNAIPYYANPGLLSRAKGIRMGVPEKFDAVRAMNGFSAQVAGYR